jgi:predicted Zn-dependent protease
MTIWEKAILNMERGSKRISLSAALFAERVQVEIEIVRLRLRIDDVQERIDELYQAIGRKVVNLARGDALPKMTEQLVLDEEIVAAMNELTERKQEIEELRGKIAEEKVSVKTDRKQAKRTSP